jgi:nitroimidazol reductase NimA-like FMN-containing flavoprotein (pyridoxamine 5'-phosphate oxidase superfamily)
MALLPRKRRLNTGLVDYVVGYDGGLGLAQPARGARQLESAEAMRLLADVAYGRVVFTLNALPAIRPVNHLVDDGRIIIRTRLASAVASTVRSTDGVVVAYEADSIDPQRLAGWSVVVTGRAHTLTDPAQVSRYEQLLQPWVNHADTVLAIESEVVTGFRIFASQA